MTVLMMVLFLVATAALYFFVFRFAVSRIHRERPQPAAERPPEDSEDFEGWTALDDRQLDRLLRESSP